MGFNVFGSIATGIYEMTFDDMIEKARQAMGKTPEERLAKARERTRKFNQQLIEQYRCSECGVDTLNYSHTFKCSWRGM